MDPYTHIEDSDYSCDASCNATGEAFGDYPIHYKNCEDCCKEEELAEGQCCPPGAPKCPKDEEGNPINILSGQKEEVEIDIEFPTPHDQKFRFYRTYKSRSGAYSSLGYGWTHNYNIDLVQPTPSVGNHYRITDESGRYHIYRDYYGDGTYVGVMSAKGSFVAELDDTFTWYRANGTKYTFNQHRQLISKEDLNGNAQTLIYDADDRLETVTDQATGRSLGFVYNADSRIQQITGPVTEAVPDGIWCSYQYDTEGNLTHVIYADDDNGSTASGFEYKYEDPNDVHNLTEKRNLAGEFLSSWTYDELDRAYDNVTRDGKGVTISGLGTTSIVVADALGMEKTYTIETISGRETITSIAGGSCTSCGDDAVRYGYDDQRRVNEIEYANGRIDQYADFGASDRYHTEIQAVGTGDERIFYYTYHPDTGDRLTITESSILGAGNKETVFDYDDDRNATPNENPTSLIHRKIERGFTHDHAGTVIAYEHITTFDYDAKGNLLEVDGPLPGDQDKITYTYDPDTGDRLTETRPLVGTIYYQYDAAGNLAQVTDVNNQVTIMTHDGRNRQLSSTRNGINSNRTYTAAGELFSTTDALGRTLDYTYNPEGFADRITDAGGDYLSFAYNEHGRRIEESIYASSDLLAHYRGADYGTAATNPAISAGKPYKSLHYSPDGTTLLETTYGYDASGNLTSMLDANTNETNYQYDLFNRLKQMTQPGAVNTIYDHDFHGNLETVTDAEGHITTYTYDDLGRLVLTVSPDTGTTRYSFDEAGNLRFRVQNGTSIEYQYDALGRLTNILYNDPAQNVTMTYDSGAGNNLLGRLASVTDLSGVTQYSYNANGRLESETRTINGVDYVTGYSYDAAGNLRSITYPTGQTIQYVPDAVDPAKIAGVTLDPDGVNQTLAGNIAYQPFGPVSNMVLGNTISISKTYDLNYQLIDLFQANGTTVLDRTYIPDNVGNVITITDNLDASRSQSFGYDNMYRLTSASGIYGGLSYTYDKVGNRLSRTRTGADASQNSYYYYTGTNRLRSVAGDHSELFMYNTDGNTTQRVSGASNPAPAVTDPADYVYNSSGQRVKKDNSDSKVFHYDMAGQLIAETDTAGNLIKAYVWLHGQPLAQIDSNGAVYYYHNDHLGTPQKMTDSSGSLVWAADYLPFGQVDVTIETVENDLRFAGQYYDQETGLHFNYHRYYDPSLGRYLRADPIQQKFPEQLGILFEINSFIYFPTDFHLYAYVQNNPVNRMDSKGLESGEFGGLGGSGGINTGGNGNYRPGFRRQDNICSSVASVFNSNRCKRGCCQAHDRCYTQFRCNSSSWFGNLTGANGPCNTCNSTAARCFSRCDECDPGNRITNSMI
jgi:RHS repeat-associated protein